jgi:glycerol uptake facilitator-like aquaporin
MGSFPGRTRRGAAEAVATGLLVAAVVGSGIMGARLAGGNQAVALLANTLATGAALVALILAFGPLSGAHMNPVVTLVEASAGRLTWRDARAYVTAQIVGALIGVVVANLMFGEPALAASQQARQSAALLFAEVVATFGLLVIVQSCGGLAPPAGALAVAAYITAAYWFTSSTSFANPAVTLARAATDTFTGIRPAHVPGFMAAQLAGGAIAAGFCGWLLNPKGDDGNEP